jgi:hypothetical protein
MEVISPKLSEALDAQLTKQAHRGGPSKSKLVRRPLTVFLESSEQSGEGTIASIRCLYLGRSGGLL